MKKILLLTLIFLLAACSPASTVSPNHAALPAADATPDTPGSPSQVQPPSSAPLNFSELDLQALAVQAGDLPAGYQGGQILDGLPKLFAETPAAERSFYQLLEREGSSAGGVAILLYPDSQQSGRAYDHLHQGMGIEESEAVAGVGERAHIYVFYQAGVSFRFVDLLFERCGAVVHIRLGETFNKETAISYAQKLDGRLSAAICR